MEQTNLQVIKDVVRNKEKAVAQNRAVHIARANNF